MEIFNKDAIKVPTPPYTYITTNKKAIEALEYISKFPIIEVDTEGTSLSPFDGKTTLLQLGIPGHSFVFDVRNDTKYSTIDFQVFKPLLTSLDHLKLLQNAVYDMKMIKYHYGFYIKNVYDTMLAEQLLHLGLHVKASLGALTEKYLGLVMDKEPQGSFKGYDAPFEPYQLEYAATDVCVLSTIRELQLIDIQKHSLERVCELEFNFMPALCEMELNGIKVDVTKWNTIMADAEKEMEALSSKIITVLGVYEDQTALFGVSSVNIDSPIQLKKSLAKFGLPLESTAEEALKKYEGIELIDDILSYRKVGKLISTYASSLMAKIHPVTGRLHTSFRQLVSTGRLSSSRPNLQNIPAKQKYRSCFIAEEGNVLITADMKGAELRILGNFSMDPIFIHSYANNIDLHTKGAAGIFNIDYNKVTHAQRKASKAISFGLVYGLSKYGLAKRLKISVKDAENLIANYFKTYPAVKKWLDKMANDAVKNHYSVSISGRKRFYSVPPLDSPDRSKAIGAIKRKGMNAPVQSSNADTIKHGMAILVERLAQLDYNAKLILTVHDEVIIETSYDHRYEVAKIVEKSICDGFNLHFNTIKMETDALISPCWMKGACEAIVDGKECGNVEMAFIPDKKYGTKLICKKCGASI